MCFRRTLGAVERVEKEFLGVSHSESLCEHFPLNCVTNSALDRAPKCWHGHAERFLLQRSSCPPSLLLLPQAGKAPAWLSENHTSSTHPGSLPPTGLPYVVGARKGSLLGTTEHTFPEKSTVQFSWSKSAWGLFFQILCSPPSTMSPERSRRVGI